MKKNVEYLKIKKSFCKSLNYITFVTDRNLSKEYFLVTRKNDFYFLNFAKGMAMVFLGYYRINQAMSFLTVQKFVSFTSALS